MTLCLDYMSQHIAQAAKRGQLIAWMQYTMACGHVDVAKVRRMFETLNVYYLYNQVILKLFATRVRFTIGESKFIFIFSL